MFKLITILTALASVASAAPALAPRSDQLGFTMAIPSYYCANSNEYLFWKGGSGTYTVQEVLHYAGHNASDDKVTNLVTASSDRRVEVPIGRVGSEFPAGSTLTWKLFDDDAGDRGVESEAVPIYNC